MELSTYLLSICSAVYATFAVLISIQARQRANLVLVFCCGVTATWAASAAFSTLLAYDGPAGFLDLIRVLSWYCYLLYLYQRSEVGSPWQIRGFSIVAAIIFVAGVIITFRTNGSPSYTLYSLPVSIRLLVCVSELLLIENLYFNLPESARWHIGLPCVLLGGLACFDILVVTDTVLFRRPSIPLASGRVVAMIIVAPLLVLAAFRDQRWSGSVKLSRAAVFHSASLVLSGSVLLSLALAGEVLRQLDATLGWIAELSLVFGGIIGISLFFSSRSARSILDRVILHHFFADRYDYRVQWLSCIDTLSGSANIEQTELHKRAIQAVANIVNSPSGILFIRDRKTGSMMWASSWNMPPGSSIPAVHPLLQSISEELGVIDLHRTKYNFVHRGSLGELGPIWLVIPLLHSVDIVGIVIVGPPRIVFQLDQEVFDLLKIVGQEVGTYIAEQRATEIVLETRSLHDYGKKFAFVAHDIKNVASQLALIVSNAERHLEDPDFQRDMLETVRSSIQKIDRLLKRLDKPLVNYEVTQCSISPVSQLKSLLIEQPQTRQVILTLANKINDARIMMEPEAFTASISHLINNAIEACPTHPVLVAVKDDADHVIIEVSDRGVGMSPEFVRDELFSPFKTRKDGGSGIGAYQARELITEAGGELLVLSEKGVGTTMRVLFKRASDVNLSSPQQLTLKTTGDFRG